MRVRKNVLGTHVSMFACNDAIRTRVGKAPRNGRAGPLAHKPIVTGMKRKLQTTVEERMRDGASKKGCLVYKGLG